MSGGYTRLEDVPGYELRKASEALRSADFYAHGSDWPEHWVEDKLQEAQRWMKAAEKRAHEDAERARRERF